MKPVNQNKLRFLGRVPHEFSRDESHQVTTPHIKKTPVDLKKGEKFGDNRSDREETSHYMLQQKYDMFIEESNESGREAFSAYSPAVRKASLLSVKHIRYNPNLNQDIVQALT